MIAALLDEGAGELDAAAFQERLEENAVELRFCADRDHFRGSLRTLRRAPRRGLRPAAARAHRAALRRRRGRAHPRARCCPACGARPPARTIIAATAWWATAFPSHPYGRPDNGTLKSVPTITPDDLRAYARRVLRRGHPQDRGGRRHRCRDAGRRARSRVRRAAGEGRARAAAGRAPAGLGRRIVIELDVPQAVLSFGGLGLARKDPDFIPAYVVNHILGGGSFSSRLYTRGAREARPGLFGLRSYLSAARPRRPVHRRHRDPRRPRRRSARAIEAEIRRMAERGPTEEELAKAKAYLKGSYPAALRHLDQDRRPARADPDRRSRHRLHRPAQQPDRRRDDRTRAASPSAWSTAACWSRWSGGPRVSPRTIRADTPGGDAPAIDRTREATPGLPRDAGRERADARSTGCARHADGGAAAAPPAGKRDDVSPSSAAPAPPGRRHRRRVSRHRRLEPRRPDAGAACRPRGAGARRAARAAAALHGQPRSRHL